MKLEELLKDLDENLTVKEYKRTKNTIYITCEKNTRTVLVLTVMNYHQLFIANILVQ